MVLYHRTWSKWAAKILDEGFQDGVGGFVWLNDTQSFDLEIKMGDGGDVILVLEVPDDVVAAFPFENRLGGWKAYKIAAEQLKMCKKPEVAETLYQGMKRPELLKVAEERKAQEAAGQILPKGLQTSAHLFEAIDFFDSRITFI